MNKDQLEGFKKAAQEEFDQLENQKDQIIKRQYELRGKYQTYDELVKLDPKDSATTIVAKPKKEIKNGK